MKTAIIIAALILTGCYAHVSVDYTKGTFSYTRWGGQEIAGLDIKKDGDLITVQMQALRTESTSQVINSVKE